MTENDEVPQPQESVEGIPVLEFKREGLEAIEKEIIPVLELYIGELSSETRRRELTSRTRETGGLLKEHHDVNLENLERLGDLLKELCQEPSQFREGAKHKDPLRYYDEFLIELRDPSEIFKRPETRLYFWMKIGKPEEVKRGQERVREKMKSVALSKSADRAAEIEDQLQAETIKELQLIIGAVQIEEEEAEGQIKEVFDSGIEMNTAGGRCVVRGYIRSYKNYYTDPLLQKVVGVESCEHLRNFISGLFSQPKEE